MATPNINDSTKNITGYTSPTNLSSTNATSVLSNAASSGKLFKVNSVYAANYDGTNAVDITLKYYSAAALGGTAYSLASTVSVPADATVVLISKDAPLYLREDSSLGATAGTASKIDIVVSYEEIS